MCVCIGYIYLNQGRVVLNGCRERERAQEKERKRVAQRSPRCIDGSYILKKELMGLLEKERREDSSLCLPLRVLQCVKLTAKHISDPHNCTMLEDAFSNPYYVKQMVATLIE